MSPSESGGSTAWKDRLDEARVKRFAGAIACVYRRFESRAYLAAIQRERCLQLELKDRINTLARCLKGYLPKRYGAAVKVLTKLAPEVGGFENWVLTSYVEQFGLEHFGESVDALRELTRYGTAEFAIRPFMIRYTERMLPILHEWAQDDNEHVRRLAAEGSRPRGVWTEHVTAFKRDPRPVIALLERLKTDSSLYVRKAVANNLNDISRDHPDLVVKTARRWLKNGLPKTAWIVKRSLRTLIKQGDPRVFPLLGFTANPKLTVSAFRPAKKRVRIGDMAVFETVLTSTARSPQLLAIDYIVHYVKRNGKTSPKVFKLAERRLAPDEIMPLKWKHSFADLSTRTHHPGRHRLEVMVNGTVVGETAVDVRDVC